MNWEEICEKLNLILLISVLLHQFWRVPISISQGTKLQRNEIQDGCHHTIMYNKLIQISKV